MAELKIQSVSVEANGKLLVDNVSLTLKPKEVVALVGPNGAGKSSLLRAIAAVEPFKGSAKLDGTEIRNMSGAQRAKALAWLPQSTLAAWPVTVREAVAIGRFAWGGTGFASHEADQRAIHSAMERTRLLGFSDRKISSLSGGELARVHLARALAAEAMVLLGDEPVAALDPAHRLAVMQILRDCAANGTAILVVLHDIALAARYADRIIALRDGRLVIEGTATEVVTPEILAALYDVSADIHWDMGVPIPIQYRSL